MRMSIATEVALKDVQQRLEALEKVVADLLLKLQQQKSTLGLKNGQR